MKKIVVDFETRSRINLKLKGHYNYARDSSTEVICLGYAIDDEQAKVWTPEGPPPLDLLDAMAEDYLIYAHNAAFERVIWHYVLTLDHPMFPPVSDKRWRCTAYQALCNNLPEGLDNLAYFLSGGKLRKNLQGATLIPRLSVPDKDGNFSYDPDDLKAMANYCRRDVEITRDLIPLMRTPSEEEEADYQVNLRINDRGILIDSELAEAATRYANAERLVAEKRIKYLTNAVVTKARGEKLKRWVIANTAPEQARAIFDKRTGKYTLDEYHRAALLQEDGLKPVVREVVALSDASQKSSVAKFATMLRMRDVEDSRIRGSYVVNGARTSGRYSAKGVQVHNFARDGVPQPHMLRARLVRGMPAAHLVKRYETSIMDILSRMLRPCIIPAPGHVFVIADWSAIEGRVAPWLSASPGGRRKLQLYKELKPVYEIAAASIFGVPLKDVTPAQRQAGKVAELSLQFGGGAGAYLAMARNYGVSATEEEATTIRDAWRATNRWAVRMWERITHCVIEAVKNPGVVYDAGLLRYVVTENTLAQPHTLHCILPSERILTYPGIQVEWVTPPWGGKETVPAFSCVHSAAQRACGETEWPRMSLWAGQLFNNAVQGTAAEIHKHTLRVLAEEYVVLHTHDEIVLEVSRNRRKGAANRLRRAMNTPPPWAKDLPLYAAVDFASRYQK